MNVLEEGLKEISDQILTILAEGTAYQNIIDYFARVDTEIENFKKSGSFYAVGNGVTVKTERISSNDESSKENNNATGKGRKTGRITRAAVLEDAQSTLNVAKSQTVKLERISKATTPTNEATDMPPPQEPACKGKTKKTTKTAKVKKEPSFSPNTERESDVFIQANHVSIINLTDTDDESTGMPIRNTRTKTRGMATKENRAGKETVSGDRETGDKNQVTTVENSEKGCGKNDELFAREKEVNSGNTAKEKPVRNTRTKTKVKANEKNVNEQETYSLEKEDESKTIKENKKETTKRMHSQSPITNESKRQKSAEYDKNAKLSDETFIKSPHKGTNNQHPIDQTVFLQKQADATVVFQRLPNANETIIIPKDQRVVVTTPLNKQVNLSELMTDDEEEKTAAKVKNKPTKPIFSAFENSPVKKRVEAFEKLGAQLATSTHPPTLNKKLKPKQNREEEDKNKTSLKPTIKSKLKMFTATPIKNAPKIVPLSTQSASKPSKSVLKDALPSKSASALKACQQDFIEREQRRQEKELEAARKREALLQAKRDENKRKREEKQMKAQQAREALIKTKQEILEETEKLQTKKVKEPLSKVPVKQTQQTVKDVPIKKTTDRPIYLDQTPPLLPLDDCYDSDDERRQDRTYRPGWTRHNRMWPKLKCISFAGIDVTNTFYMCEATTPDLQMLFGRINANKLKRNSSAIWNKPPRFTTMPIPNEEDEEDIL